ncbi:hypothetical protein H6G76_14005 [Nostoc sp. FACHB-152]|nr:MULTISPECIES: hypothetical protein [unclassified Nostoc]MBD2448260.1 hypothetical protein [Nostoc sp. FACHB-152]MBD2469282.1 hypothetical protein [Nostoc sp. FACHB-145]
MPKQTETIMVRLFLDFLIKEAMKNSTALVPYTEKMSNEINDLLKDVT